MKMTKGNMKELLKDNNYLEGLAFVANRVMKFKTFEGQDNERCRIFNKLINWAYDFEDMDGENDYSGNVLRIDSAIWAAIDI